MGKTNALIHSFSAGEVSRSGLARVDQETVRLNAERQENLFPYEVGKAIMRPGLQMLDTAYSNNASRIVPFIRSTEHTSLLEMGIDGSGNAQMRVFVNDVPVTRNSVMCTISDPSFGTGVGWTVNNTGGSTATFGVSGLTLQAVGIGSQATVYQHVSTSSPNVAHALRITVNHGTVTFLVGSTQGATDLFGQQDLGTGYHSLSFTPPSSSFYIQFQTQSQTQVVVASVQVESAGVMVLPGAWTSSTLQSIRWAQSIDVLFLAISGERQLKVQRFGDASWSIVNYYASDGPLSVGASVSTISMTPGGSLGNTTLTASAPFFQSGHVGAIFAVTHDRMNVTYVIGASQAFTPAFRVTGVHDGGDRVWGFQVSGVWSGLIILERSFNNQTSGFQPWEILGTSGPSAANSNQYTPDSSATVKISSNGFGTIADVDDNAIVWYRFRFSAYTSGAAFISIQYGGYGFTGIARVTSLASSTVANVEVLSPFANIIPSLIWQEGQWSAVQGFPTAVSIYDGRLWWARDDQVWGSVSDNYTSFAVSSNQNSSSTTQTTDSSSIQRTVATGSSVPEVRWLLPLQRLLIGNSGSEASARSNSLDEALTPTNITIKDSSTQGSADSVPVKVDTIGMFIQRSTRKIYALAYDIYISDYRANDLMRTNEDLGYPESDPSATTGFLELAVQRQPCTYVFARRSDGIVCSLIFNPQEKIAGWFKMITGADASDKVVSMAVLPSAGEDIVYFVTQRLINGETSYFIERMRNHQDTLTKIVNNDGSVSTYQGIYQVDCHSTFTVSGAATISGLSYLQGRAVMAIGFSVSRNTYGPLSNGSGGYTFMVNPGGQITLGEAVPNNSVVCVGLPYTGFYKSAKLAYGAQQGTPLLMKKRVVNGGLLMQDTHPNAILMGPDPTRLYALPQSVDGEIVSTTTASDSQYDHQTFPFASEWSTDSRVCIQVNPGYAATLTGLVVGVETNEAALGQ